MEGAKTLVAGFWFFFVAGGGEQGDPPTFFHDGSQQGLHVAPRTCQEGKKSAAPPLYPGAEPARRSPSAPSVMRSRTGARHVSRITCDRSDPAVLACRWQLPLQPQPPSQEQAELTRVALGPPHQIRHVILGQVVL